MCRLDETLAPLGRACSTAFCAHNCQCASWADRSGGHWVAMTDFNTVFAWVSQTFELDMPCHIGKDSNEPWWRLRHDSCRDPRRLQMQQCLDSDWYESLQLRLAQMGRWGKVQLATSWSMESFIQMIIGQSTEAILQIMCCISSRPISQAQAAP